MHAPASFRFILCATALLVGGAVGCHLDPQEGGDDGADSGTAETGSPGTGGHTGEAGTIPGIGDSYDGGTVVGSTTHGDCTQITVQYPPTWSCSASQIEEATNGYQGQGGAGGGPTTEEEAVALQESTCEGLADLRREALKQTGRNNLGMARNQELRENCLPRTETRYFDSEGQPSSYCGYPSMDGGYGGMGGSGGASSSGGSGGGTDEYSTTNTQVAGVDEADFVKNDGEFVYVLSADGLHVIDAWPAEDAHEIAHLTSPGEPRRLYLAGDRLLVYSYLANDPGASPGVPSSQGCTYGYGCRFTSEGGRTLARVLDVSNPAQPIELARYEMSGGYADSRRIGPTVYTVVHDEGASSIPGLNLDLTASSPDVLEATYAARVAAVDQAVAGMTMDYFLPWVRELDTSGQVKAEVTACNRALAATAASGGSFVSVVSLDLTGALPPARAIVATKPGFVYASQGALYFATDGVDGSDEISVYSNAADDRSTIHKFKLNGTDVSYVGSTGIRGHVLNQFSMDEDQGILRVATSSGWVPDPSVTSSITTVQEDAGGGLSVVGELTGLAPQEDIRAVRFDGDRGFVVTFKKTDPLFVIDLSTPSHPAVLGELKIPGFSTYLHRLDANHLLAVGFDADDQGSYAYFDGIQLQIFDVTDMANPVQLHKTIIGTRGSGSEALMNHLAFNYFAPKKMLALPMTICEGGDNGVYGDELTFAGLMVFDVSPASGITEHGRMPFVDPSQGSQYATCGLWWTDSTSLVKRSIFMGDYAIGISDDTLNVAALADLDTVLQSIPLAQ